MSDANCGFMVLPLSNEKYELSSQEIEVAVIRYHNIWYLLYCCWFSGTGSGVEKQQAVDVSVARGLRHSSEFYITLPLQPCQLNKNHNISVPSPNHLLHVSYFAMFACSAACSFLSFQPRGGLATPHWATKWVSWNRSEIVFEIEENR